MEMNINENHEGKSKGFLPISAQDVKDRGWDSVDFVFVTGDAYVDHPSFGVAIITRVLESEGFRVAVLSQPNLTQEDFLQFGKPVYGFLVTSGNIDSMVSHYTVAKKRRSDDKYSPGGKRGNRPDRAVLSYCSFIRKVFGDIPIILGGLEASLRRFAHYDYWDDKVHPSVLTESDANILVYGMGENQTRQVARRMRLGENISTITDVKGTCYFVDVQDTPYTGVECPSFKNVISSKKEYAISCRIQKEENDCYTGKIIKQRQGSKMLVQNPPMLPLTTGELDSVYALPYKRYYHPLYEPMGGVPAIEEVEFSITHNRGCFGDCNFCSLAFHQGKAVTCRSKKSIITEAKRISESAGFKGYIHDIGGPTANFRHASCEQQKTKGLCKNKKCLAPKPCLNLKVDHKEYLDILRSVRVLPGIKKVFIRSGIRYDYILADNDKSFFEELVKHHVSGQLKVAPEHCSATVLDYMGKPYIDSYLEFKRLFFAQCKKINKEQYLVPYFISSHPGSTLKDAVELALFLKQEKIRPEQVQDFYPTPGTISTCMFYTGLDPYTLESVYVAHSAHEKAMQRALLQYFNPKNKRLVFEALTTAGRTELIGNGEKCLIRSEEKYYRGKQGKKNQANSAGRNRYKKQ